MIDDDLNFLKNNVNFAGSNIFMQPDDQNLFINPDAEDLFNQLMSIHSKKMNPLNDKSGLFADYQLLLIVKNRR